MKRLIVTGDDFGLSSPVNDAIEIANTKGILTTTCLMVTAPEAADAVARAKRLSNLAVGLHVVVTRGVSALPPAEIPDLVDQHSQFDGNLARAGMRYFLSMRARRQLAAEIRAQFDAFKATGLPLDHVNAHNHMHLHPTVLSLIMEIGKDYGLRAVRVPLEPAGSMLLRPWISLMKARLRARRLRYNDYVFGLRNSGQMDRDQVLSALSNLPEGTTEMFFHPATGRWDDVDVAATAYRFEDEFKALVHPDVQEAVGASGATLSAFRDL